MRCSQIFGRLLLGSAALFSAAAVYAREPQLNLIKLPEGFSITVHVSEVPGARSMARGDKGTLFVSTRSDVHIYGVADSDGDGVPETVHKIGSSLNSPNGIAFKDGSLYVAEISRIIRYDGIEDSLASPPEPVVVYDQLPTEGHHGWKYLAFGPDGRLYFNIGAPCNICNMEAQDPRFATISRLNADGTGFEIFARGVRNSVGFTWHPENKNLWFTDNGRDLLGDDRPPCELNVATELGQHFGYPYCHGGNDPDPEFAAGRKCEEFVAPLQNMAAHVAPLGLKFYTGDKFPAEYKGAVFIAEHGSWNRSIPQGYRITVVKFDEQGAPLPWEVFAEGWLRRTLAWGRPVDVLMQDDGSMLVSDDKAGVIYRIAYTG